MSRYVTDTHAFIWYLQSSMRLSANVRNIFVEADDAIHEIFVPSIVLVELIYLAEHKHIERNLIKDAFDSLNKDTANYLIAPLTIETARALLDIDRNKIPDMPDRIITATAKQLSLPLITRDQRITSSRLVDVVW